MSPNSLLQLRDSLLASLSQAFPCFCVQTAKGSLSNLTSSTVLTLNPADAVQDAQWMPEVVDPMRLYNPVLYSRANLPETKPIVLFGGP